MTKVSESKLDFLNPNIYTGIIKPEGFSSATLDALTNKQEGWLSQDSDKNALVRYDGSDWKVISGSSVNNSVYDAIVGAVGDYQTLAAAVGDGKLRIAVVGDTTESVNIEFVANNNYVIDIYDAQINLGNASQFDCANGALSVEINGKGSGKLLFSYTTTKDPFINVSSSFDLHIDGLDIVNSSTASGCGFPVSTSVTFNTFTIDRSKYTLSGASSVNNSINLTASYPFMSNCFLSYSGADSSTLLTTGDNALASNVVVSSNITNSPDSNKPMLNMTGGCCTNFAFSGGVQFIKVIGNLSNSRVNNSVLKFNGDESNISNITGNGATIQFNPFNNCTVSNVSIPGNATLMVCSGNGNSISNLIYDGVFEYSGDLNTIIGSRIGPAAGGTVANIILSGDNNIAIGNQTDQAVTTPGTGNVAANNVVY